MDLNQFTRDDGAKRLIVEGDAHATASWKLTRYWDFTDLQQAQTLLAALNSNSTRTNPKVDGIAITGTFTATKVWSEQERGEDRAVRIFETLKEDGAKDLDDSYKPNCQETHMLTYHYDISEAQVNTILSDYDSSVQGRNVSVSISYNSKDGTFDVRVLERQGHGQTWTYDSADSKTSGDSTTKKINQTAVQNTGTADQGEVIRSNSSLNEYCYYDTNLVTSTSKAVGVHDTWTTNRGTSELYVYRNQRTIPAAVAALPSSSNNNVSISINNDLTYDIVIRKSPISHSGSTPDWENGSDLYFKYTNNYNDAIYVYTKYTSSENDTEDWIRRDSPYDTFHSPEDEADYTTIGADSGNKTGRHYLGRGRWKATRVERYSG